MAKLVIPDRLYRQVQTHLLRDQSERLAFFLCNISWAGESTIFIAQEAILVDDADLAWPISYRLELKLEPLLAVVNRAVKGKKALVEAHSHPFSDYPTFSPSDRAGFQEFVPYVLDSVKGAPYGATVWGKRGLTGVAWSSWPQDEQPLDVTVVGSRLRKPTNPGESPSEIGRYDRQIRAFGKEVQNLLATLRVGIVGLGGVGSHVAQQLAYLGVRSLILVDGQTVEETNLNRLVGATPRDLGKPKVEVIASYLRRVSPGLSVHAVSSDLGTPAALDAFKLADVLFGCVDNDGARLIVNELSVAYLIPYLDIGTEISVRDGAVEEAGGRVNLILPEGPCLNCMGQIDREEARIALSSDVELQGARERGYITGYDEPSAAVVSLNGTVASLAVTEFLNLVTGLRAPQPFIAYDALGAGRGRNAQWVVPQRAENMKGCFECSLSGIGDAVNLARYYK